MIIAEADDPKHTELYRWVMAHFAKGNFVAVCGYGVATLYKPKHAGMFRLTRSGLHVQRGRRWDCINYAAFQVYTKRS